MDVGQIKFSERKILDLALNIARLQLHRCFLDDGKLVMVGEEDGAMYIRQFQGSIEFEAKGMLMLGPCSCGEGDHD